MFGGKHTRITQESALLVSVSRVGGLNNVNTCSQSPPIPHPPTLFISGIIYRLASYYTLERLRIDDPLNAFAVHWRRRHMGRLSLLGLLLRLLRRDGHPPHRRQRHARGGLLYGNGNMIGAAAIFLVTAICWVGLSSISMFLLLRRLDICAFPIATSTRPITRPASRRAVTRTEAVIMAQGLAAATRTRPTRQGPTRAASAAPHGKPRAAGGRPIVAAVRNAGGAAVSGSVCQLYPP